MKRLIGAGFLGATLMVSGMAHATQLTFNPGMPGMGDDSVCQLFTDLDKDFKDLKCDKKDLKHDEKELKCDVKDVKSDKEELCALITSDGCPTEIKELRCEIKTLDKDMCEDKTDIKDEKHDMCGVTEDIQCVEHQLHEDGIFCGCHCDPVPLPAAAPVGGVGLLMAAAAKWLRSHRTTIA
jgi:hypothetical protein